jgi:hypothetical protein
MSDVFQRIEAHVVAIGERLEESRRYRTLSAEAERLYAASSRIARRVREATRDPGGGEANAAVLEREISALADRARNMLAELIESRTYRDLVAALEAGDGQTAARLVPEVFDGVEAVRPSGPLYLPLSPKRGEKMIDPAVAADRIATMAHEGIEPQHSPGPGADAKIQPIRFYEQLAGLDSPLLVVVAGEHLPEPSFRATELGEILVYRQRISLPFSVGLRAASPDDWLEVRGGGYESYRERCRELCAARGIAITEL